MVSQLVRNNLTLIKVGSDGLRISPTPKSFEEASAALEEAVVDQGFGVLAVHDLGHTLRTKGLPFPEQCRIFEVCNPEQAAAVLSTTMALNMALPCRISVYTEAGQTRLGMIRPEVMLAGLSADPSLKDTSSHCGPIKARSETVASKPLFWGPSRHRWYRSPAPRAKVLWSAESSRPITQIGGTSATVMPVPARDDIASLRNLAWSELPPASRALAVTSAPTNRVIRSLRWHGWRAG